MLIARKGKLTNILVHFSYFRKCRLLRDRKEHFYVQSKPQPSAGPCPVACKGSPAFKKNRTFRNPTPRPSSGKEAHKLVYPLNHVARHSRNTQRVKICTLVQIMSTGNNGTMLFVVCFLAVTTHRAVFSTAQ